MVGETRRGKTKTLLLCTKDARCPTIYRILVEISADKRQLFLLLLHLSKSMYLGTDLPAFPVLVGGGGCDRKE